MCAPNVEEEIVRLGPEVSRVYFDAKETLTTEQDSRSERFSTSARIVRAFWMKVVSTHRRNKDTHSKAVPIRRMH
jgi:hypothetical protein